MEYRFQSGPFRGYILEPVVIRKQELDTPWSDSKQGSNIVFSNVSINSKMK